MERSGDMPDNVYWWKENGYEELHWKNLIYYNVIRAAVIDAIPQEIWNDGEDAV